MLDWLRVTEGTFGARLLNSNLSPYWTFNLIVNSLCVYCQKNYYRKLHFCLFQGREEITSLVSNIFLSMQNKNNKQTKKKTPKRNC